MTKIELKQNIHSIVDTIEDETLLEELNDILNYRVNNESISVTPEEMEAINEGLKDVEEGNTITYEEFKKNHSEWFGK